MAKRLGSTQVACLNPAVGHIFFLHIFRYSLTHSYFLIAKKQGFLTNLRFFDERAFFLKNYPFSTLMKKIYILQYFKKIGNFFIFPS